MADGDDKKPNRGWQNLRPARPGEVRNPKGKNGQPWVKAFYDYFGRERVDDVTDPLLQVDIHKRDRKIKKVTRLRNVWAATFRKAMLGSDAAQRLIIETMHGRQQSVHVTGDGSSPNAVVMLLPDDGSGDDLLPEPLPDADSAITPPEGPPEPDDAGDPE